MIKIQALSIKYDDKLIKENLNIELPSTGLIGVYGKSGCGKSSLFQIIAGFNNNYSGNIYFNDNSIKDCSIDFFQENINYIPQEYNCFEENTVEENILASVFDTSLLDYYTTRYNLNTLMKQKMAKLSLGEHQRVSLVITFLNQRKINLLDELLCNLDYETKQLALEDLKKLSQNTLVALISHQIGEIKEFCDKTLDLSVHNNIKLSSTSINYKNSLSKYKVSPLKIKPYKNIILKSVATLFIIFIMALAVITLNISTGSYSQSYINKIIQQDVLGLGIDIAEKTDLEEYFENVEIPFYDLEFLCEYNANTYKYYNGYNNPDSKDTTTFTDFIVLDEIELNGKNIKIKDMEIIVPDEFNNIELSYDENGNLYRDGGAFNISTKRESVKFKKGNVFNILYSNIRDIDFKICETYNRKELFAVLREYMSYEDALKYSKIIIINENTFMKLLSRFLNLQVDIKTSTGDIYNCFVTSYVQGKQQTGIIEFNDEECYIRNNEKTLEECGYNKISNDITLLYNGKEYTKNYKYNLYSSIAPTFPIFYPKSFSNDFFEIEVTYNEFFEIYKELGYDFFKEMKPINKIVDLKKNSLAIADDIVVGENKVLFSNLYSISSKGAFNASKRIYFIVSIALLFIFIVGFFGYSLYNRKELKQISIIMKYKMYPCEIRKRYIYYKNILSPICFCVSGIAIGLFIVILGYNLNWNYFYSIEWKPYLICFVVLLVVSGIALFIENRMD